jgi:phosphoribosylformimino-5-aminoimidazole carboxamide ribotide isomerase
VDLRGGRVVQLVGGVPGTEQVVLDDPVATAQRWQAEGFRALHVIDLDAALGKGDNREVTRQIIASVEIPVQAGGGVRTTGAVGALLEAGASRVIVGTRAVMDAKWLEEIAGRWPGCIMVAADVRDGNVLIRGWTAASDVHIESLAAALEDLPLAGVLVTDVSREGRMQGIDAAQFTALAGLTRHPLIAAGGISSIADIHALERAGAAGAVLGMSLYKGALDMAVLIREFA